MSNFRKKFEELSRKNKSLLCVGLDPDLESMAIKDVAFFNREIIEATHGIASAYKPNLAFYEQFGFDGLKGLEATLKCIPADTPIIGDCKRADIGSSSMAYARAMFDMWGFDAITVNPYLGRDAIKPFLDRADKEVFILCRTSNYGAKDFQDLLVESNGHKEPLFSYVANRAQEWNGNHNVGLVVGATSPLELGQVRTICPSMLFLLPGVGAQGGDLDQAIRNGVDESGRAIIVNVSRQILYASKDAHNFAKVSRAKALEVRDLINATLTEIGKPWQL